MSWKLINPEGTEIELTADALPQEVSDQIVKKAQGLVYSNIDTHIKEKFGVEKAANEKTSDYISRIISGKNEEIETLKGSAPELAKLQGDIEKLKTTNSDLQKKLTESEKDFEKRLNAEYVTSTVAGLSITVPAYLTDEAEIKSYVEDQKALLSGKFDQKYYVKTEKDGSRKVFNKADNSEVTDDNVNPLKAEDILKRDSPHLFKVVDENKEPGGSGKPNPTQGKGLNTFEKISAEAVKKGMTPGSSDYTAFVSKTATENGVEY